MRGIRFSKKALGLAKLKRLNATWVSFFDGNFFWVALKGNQPETTHVGGSPILRQTHVSCTDGRPTQSVGILLP